MGARSKGSGYFVFFFFFFLALPFQGTPEKFLEANRPQDVSERPPVSLPEASSGISIWEKPCRCLPPQLVSIYKVGHICSSLLAWRRGGMERAEKAQTLGSIPPSAKRKLLLSWNRGEASLQGRDFRTMPAFPVPFLLSLFLKVSRFEPVLRFMKCLALQTC